jgi:hypothetical protein
VGHRQGLAHREETGKHVAHQILEFVDDFISESTVLDGISLV